MSERSASSRAKSVDLWFTVAILLFLAVIFVLSLSLSRTAGSVPLLISAIGMLLCIISLIARPKQGGAADAQEGGKADEHTVGFFPCTGLMVAYFLGMVLLGFIVSTFLMLAFLPVLLGYRKTLVNIVFSAVTTAILYVTFVKFFYVRLPMGVVFNLLS